MGKGWSLGHTKHRLRGQNHFVLYDVYDNKRDGLPVCIGATAIEAARATGMTKVSFYAAVTKKLKRWTIIRHFAGEEEE